MAEKLQSRFESILEDSENSFESVSKAVKKYKTDIIRKRDQLIKNSEVYYNAEQTLGDEIPSDLLDMITNHQKILQIELGNYY